MSEVHVATDERLTQRSPQQRTAHVASADDPDGFDVLVLDAGPGGLRAVTPIPFQRGTQIRCVIETDSGPMPAQGVVVWQLTEGDEIHIGLRFTHVDPELSLWLAEQVRSHRRASLARAGSTSGPAWEAEQPPPAATASGPVHAPGPPPELMAPTMEEARPTIPDVVSFAEEGEWPDIGGLIEDELAGLPKAEPGGDLPVDVQIPAEALPEEPAPPLPREALQAAPEVTEPLPFPDDVAELFGEDQEWEDEVVVESEAEAYESRRIEDEPTPLKIRIQPRSRPESEAAPVAAPVPAPVAAPVSAPSSVRAPGTITIRLPKLRLPRVSRRSLKQIQARAADAWSWLVARVKRMGFWRLLERRNPRMHRWARRRVPFLLASAAVTLLVGSALLVLLIRDGDTVVQEGTAAAGADSYWDLPVAAVVPEPTAPPRPPEAADLPRSSAPAKRAPPPAPERVETASLVPPPLPAPSPPEEPGNAQTVGRSPMADELDDIVAESASPRREEDAPFPGAPALRLRLSGNPEGVNHYPLANPNGIVIDVPRRSHPGSAERLEPDHPLVRFIKVIERDDGVRFIIYLHGPMPPYEVVPARDALRVRFPGRNVAE